MKKFKKFFVLGVITSAVAGVTMITKKNNKNVLSASDCEANETFINGRCENMSDVSFDEDLFPNIDPEDYTDEALNDGNLYPVLDPEDYTTPADNKSDEDKFGSIDEPTVDENDVDGLPLFPGYYPERPINDPDYYPTLNPEDHTTGAGNSSDLDGFGNVDEPTVDPEDTSGLPVGNEFFE